MKDLEEILANKKKEIDKIEVPENLEDKLRSALDGKKQPKIKRKWQGKIAALLVIGLLLSFNIDTIAEYAKGLINYKDDMPIELKELYDLGEGQNIGKSYTFKNGVVVTLDAVMFDEEGLRLFYTTKDPNGKLNTPDRLCNEELVGRIGRYEQKEGQGKNNEDLENTWTWIVNYEKPSILEKELKFIFATSHDKDREVGEISFKLDMNKAKDPSTKNNINKEIKVDAAKVGLNSIIVNESKTVIYGTVKDISNIFFFNEYPKGEEWVMADYSMDIRLIANGKEIKPKGREVEIYDPYNFKGIEKIKFRSEYDSLPNDLKTLQIKLVGFSVGKDIDEKIILKKGKNNGKIEVLDQNIHINNVYESNGKTYIVITTDKGTLLKDISLMADGEEISYKDSYWTEEDEKLYGYEGSETRALCFNGTGKELILKIEKLQYMKEYNKFIDIPIKR